jgi:DNA uptake protein ComE-like DNA-binding protein/Tfp pilus assembly protein PilV
MAHNSGMALVAVMVALIVLSAMAASMAVSIQTEARTESAEFDALQAQELARSGQEIATFLQNRGITSNLDLMAGLPFEAVIPGFHYRARTTAGTIDIYFESDNGKINPSAAAPELTRNFFAAWTGDFATAQVVADSLGDWSDPDDEVRQNGAEAGFYSSLNVLPRNAALGIADLAFIRGITARDLRSQVTGLGPETKIRQGVDGYLTAASGDGAININFAPELVLQAIPGLDAAKVGAIVSSRRGEPFKDMNAVQARTGITPESQAWRYLTVSRNSPAVLSVAKLNSSGLMRSERYINYVYMAFNYLSGAVESKSALGKIERNVFPDFL